MTRRARVCLVPLVLAVPALAGCATFTNVDRVATINGEVLDRDEFEAMADDFFAHPEVFEAPAPVNGRGEAESARRLLAIAAQAQLLHEVASDDAIDAARGRALAALPPDDPIREMSSEMQNLYGEIVSRQEVLAEVPVPTPDELERGYAVLPASVGVLCVRHILVDTEAEANRIAAELAAGTDFASLAEDHSTDTITGADGGIVPGSTGPCWSLGEAIQGLVPEFTQQALRLPAGEPSAPFASQFGWHIVVQRPWSEVADDVVAFHAEGITGDVQYVAALLTADVEVDPGFGVWSPTDVAIVPIG